MKQIVLTFFLSIFFFSAAYAQDLESATNLCKEGNAALNEGNTALALEKFQTALEQADIIGPDADEIAGNCKSIIPTLHLALGKEAAAAKDMEKAIPLLKKAIEVAGEYGQDDVLAEATSLIPQLYMAEGNKYLNEGKFAEAVAEYQKAIDNDATNAMAYLRMGQASIRANDEAKAIESLNKAKELGQEKAASKEISTYYLKKAAASLKAKKYADAASFAGKSNEALENPTAFNISGKANIALKKYDEAIASFESYLSLNPKAKDGVQTMYQLAVSYEAKGNNDKACGYYKQIVTDPNFAEYAKSKITALKCN